MVPSAVTAFEGGFQAWHCLGGRYGYTAFIIIYAQKLYQDRLAQSAQEQGVLLHQHFRACARYGRCHTDRLVDVGRAQL